MVLCAVPALVVAWAAVGTLVDVDTLLLLLLGLLEGLRLLSALLDELLHNCRLH